MAVFCEFISLIILRDSIDKYFPGGWKRFVLEVPNRSMATDGEVVRVGFMNPVDTNIYLEFLKGEGLQFRQSGDREIDDISDLDQFMGHRDERQWLEFGDRAFNEHKYFCAWKKGSSIDTIARPSDAGQMMINVSPEIFNERFKYIKSENGLEIYSDTKYPQREKYLPEGMSIEEYFEYYSDRRKERENRTKKIISELEKGKDDNIVEKQKAQDLIEAEEKKALEKMLEKDRLIQQKKAQEFRKAQEKKEEDDLYVTVAKKLKKKTLDRTNPAVIVEMLIEQALKKDDEKDLDLIVKFWQLNCRLGYFDIYDDGDTYSIFVDPIEAIRIMKFEWEDYYEEDPSLLSDEERFKIFSDRIEGAIEREYSDGCALIIKRFGEFFLSANHSDPREGLAYFDIGSYKHIKNKRLNDSGLIESDDVGERNFTERELEDYFNQTYYQSDALDVLVKALMREEGVDKATKNFNKNINDLITDEKKVMMYSIPIDVIIENFKESLSEQHIDKGFEYHKTAMEMNISDFQEGHVVINHYDYFLTADYNLWEQCSSFNIFDYESGMHEYYKEKGLVLFSLNEQYPPLNYSDEEMRELYDKCFKKLY